MKQVAYQAYCDVLLGAALVVATKFRQTAENPASYGMDIEDITTRV